MKRIAAVILVIVMCVILYGCGSDYTDWASVKIKCGTIKVPANWTVSYIDDLMFFSENADDSNNIYAFQSNSFSGFEEEFEGDIEMNAISDEFQSLYTVSSNVISNGTVYGEAVVSVDGTKCNMKYLDFSSEENEVQFFVISNEVSDETFMKIAESFVSD